MQKRSSTSSAPTMRTSAADLPAAHRAAIEPTIATARGRRVACEAPDLEPRPIARRRRMPFPLTGSMPTKFTGERGRQPAGVETRNSFPVVELERSARPCGLPATRRLANAKAPASGEIPHEPGPGWESSPSGARAARVSRSSRADLRARTSRHPKRRACRPASTAGSPRAPRSPDRAATGGARRSRASSRPSRRPARAPAG